MKKQSATRSILSGRKWYLIANRTEARIYQERPRRNGLDLVIELDNPESRLAERDLDSDRAGRSISSYRGGGVVHGLEKATNRRTTLASRFAAKIARELQKCSREERFTNLVLVANPSLLGLLREYLPAALRRKVGEEIRLDLVNEPVRELVSRFQKVA